MSRLPGTQKHKATTQLIRENCTQSPLIPTLTAGGDVNSSDARVSPSVISLLEHYDNKANDEPPSRQKRSRFSFMTKTSKDGPEVLSNSPAAFDLSLNLSNALASSKGNTGIGRDYWLDDASATKCRLCDHDYEKWATVLVKSLKKINNIEFDVKPLDETGFASVDTYYNFTNYIKIKKIQGANFQKAETVEGVVFSKKLPNKNMPSAISNPRIMLITFPIEYEQEEQNSMHFQSLEAVIAQQDQYIRKLVDRIINLRPSIILSSSSVNGLALGIFAEAGLAVAPNCKLTNLVKLYEAQTGDLWFV
ncbi:hypothetical protein BOH78_4757 [Pichia kudriavzevii]|uniref:Uncharacterized protein n=1 Tax=Pichia kudriavzevii TaxID=4909 RepID=A0A1V2LGD2_PICKU|nr:hypothetical protein BOH78_4757 [Pichia kudriavzevii]